MCRTSTQLGYVGLSQPVNRIIQHCFSCFVVLRLLLELTIFVGAFNVDLNTVVIHERPDASMFGFAVAQHRERGKSWLLVGAPKANSRQPNVTQGGVVFKCSIEVPNDCQEIMFDRTGPRYDTKNEQMMQIDDKSGQWFGATIHSSGPNGIVVACAPRYIYFSANFRRREPVGTCFTARNSFTQFQEYSPCRTAAWGYHRQGFCQAGFSAALTPDSRRLFIGAVGSWYWQGQVFVQDLFSTIDLLATEEGPAKDDDSYLGYSSTVGEFSGDGEPDVAVGMPRGSNLLGKVVLFNSTLHNLNNITGEQIGAYFGYSLCVVDVNSDGLDDVIVGAPFYSDFETKDGSYEIGRVYVIFQDSDVNKTFEEFHQFTNRQLLNGQYSRSRFGLSLTSAGDINRDEFGDFVVGAPYGGQNGRGVVYIFYGSELGVQVTTTQVIFAEDVDSTLSTFGFSLSGGTDLDINEYPDLLVGAYASNKALLFKSRPVVSVSASLTVNPEKINLDDKGCSLLDGTLVSCVVIHLCLEYSGVGLASKMEFQFVTQLDVLKTSGPRVFFLTSEQDHVQNFSAILQKDSIYCKSIFIYIKSAVQDKLTPIIVGTNYSLMNRKSNLKNEVRPILDKNTKSSLHKQISIQKNCGKDNICIPDLQLSCESKPITYLMGSQDRLELLINVTNAGEDAFETSFYMDIPSGVEYVNIDRKLMDSPFSCTNNVLSENNYQCDIGNPLKANETILFTIILEPKYLNSSDDTYEFTLQINSSNLENISTEFNNYWVVRVPVKLQVELLVSGISIPDVVLYNKTVSSDVQTSEVDVGPEIIHLYDVWNRGPSPIIEAEIYILWPTYTMASRDLLYLIDQPEVSSLGNCEFIPNVNYLNLTLTEPQSSSLKVFDINDSLQFDTEHYSVHHQTKLISRDLDESFQKELSCRSTLCTKIFCTAHSLGKGDHVYFRIRSRLWTNSIRTLGFDELKISSKLVARVTALPYAVHSNSVQPSVYLVETLVTPADGLRSRIEVPWWIIVAAVSAGILLLFILVLILRKLGFFNRNRPHKKVEQFQLHKCERNGKLVNGDEFL